MNAQIKYYLKILFYKIYPKIEREFYSLSIYLNRDRGKIAEMKKRNKTEKKKSDCNFQYRICRGMIYYILRFLVYIEFIGERTTY